jgi:peptidoglycan lytic transglycosylase
LCRNEKESVVENKDGKKNGKMLLAAFAVLALQLIPFHLVDVSAAESGVASVYSIDDNNGTGTASGQKLDDDALTAAHKSLPFGTKVKVTNKNNGRTVVVTINDRGPFVRGRVIDLTPAGARALGFNGLTQVTLNVGNHGDGGEE